MANLRGSAESVSWSADGRALLVLAADPGSYALDWSARFVTGADGVAPPIRRPADAWRRLFRVDVMTGEADEVGPAGLSVWEVDWDGGSTVVALVSEDPSGNGWYHGHLAMLDLERRSARSIVEPRRMLEGVALSPDGTRAAVVEGYSSDPGLLIGNVLVIDLASGRIDDPWPDLQTVGRVSWADDGHLWYARYDGTGTAIGELWPDGRRAERWAGDAFIGPDLTKPSLGLVGGTVLATHQAHGLPPELATFDLATATWTRRTHVNDAVIAGVRFPDCRVVRWTASDGETIEARLLTPHGATGPWPLIVAVHGGPTWNWNAYFSDSEPNGVLLADAGYAVLQPNPRGSSGRGHAFAEAVIGDPGGIDFDDLLAGVDWAVATGIVRSGPDRHRGAFVRRLHGRLGGHPERPLRRLGGRVGRRRLPVVPPDVRGRVVGRGSPRRRLGRTRRPVSRPVAGGPCASRHDPDAGHRRRARPVHAARAGRAAVRGAGRRGLRDGAAGAARGGTRAGEPARRAGGDPGDAGLVRPMDGSGRQSASVTRTISPGVTPALAASDPSGRQMPEPPAARS